MRFELIEALLRIAITMRDNEGQDNLSPADKVRHSRQNAPDSEHLRRTVVAHTIKHKKFASEPQRAERGPVFPQGIRARQLESMHARCVLTRMQLKCPRYRFLPTSSARPAS